MWAVYVYCHDPVGKNNWIFNYQSWNGNQLLEFSSVLRPPNKLVTFSLLVVCLFVRSSLSKLVKNLRTNFHEILLMDSLWPSDQLIRFWYWSSSERCEAKDLFFNFSNTQRDLFDVEQLYYSKRCGQNMTKYWRGHYVSCPKEIIGGCPPTPRFRRLWLCLPLHWWNRPNDYHV